MKPYTQRQATELRRMLDDIIEARDNFHGGDLHRAVDTAKSQLQLMDKYDRG